ncbi:MAG: DUF4386 family protein [Acidimicrobiales bacterium]
MGGREWLLIPTVGLIGAPLLLASVTATIFGLVAQVSPVGLILALPIAVWELSLGMWLVAKGFRPSPIISGDVPAPVRSREGKLASAAA